MAQHTLQQLRDFGIKPDTDLGQHFLVDDNLLDVIADLAALGPDDVCYEPGAGVGVLTRYLAQRTAHVHAVELDERLKPALDAIVAEHPNLNMIWGDAMHVVLADLQPVPTKLVSNLPYHVAAPIVAEALQHAPSVRRFCVMIQKEVGERMFAPVGSSTYGGVSVLVQALCEKRGVHKVSRSVFVPPPNVDSVLLAFERVDADGLRAEQVPAFASFVKQSFLHRRKTLANNLLTEQGVPRERVVQQLAVLGLKPAARPQELSAAQFVQLYGALLEETRS